MVSMSRTMILPAAFAHQTLMAEAVASTEAAGVKDADTVTALREFVGLASKLRKATAAVERASAVHLEDPMKHAQHIKIKVIPAMQELRTVADELQLHVADEFWPMPTYRELLFLK